MIKHLLIADQNEEDILLTTLGCRNSRIPHTIHIVEHGQELIHYLSGIGPYTDRRVFPFPNLILLDVDIPGMENFQALKIIRGVPEWKSLPVVAMGRSNVTEDVDQAYAAGATSFVLKSTDQTVQGETIKLLLSHWFEFKISSMERRTSRVAKPFGL